MRVRWCKTNQDCPRLKLERETTECGVTRNINGVTLVLRRRYGLLRNARDGRRKRAFGREGTHTGCQARIL